MYGRNSFEVFFGVWTRYDFVKLLLWFVGIQLLTFAEPNRPPYSPIWRNWFLNSLVLVVLINKMCTNYGA